jgi:hypothetical protein
MNVSGLSVSKRITKAQGGCQENRREGAVCLLSAEFLLTDITTLQFNIIVVI